VAEASDHQQDAQHLGEEVRLDDQVAQWQQPQAEVHLGDEVPVVVHVGKQHGQLVGAGRAEGAGVVVVGDDRQRRVLVEPARHAGPSASA
jgi:hypothetical protein